MLLLLAAPAPAEAPPGRIDFEGESASLLSAKRAAADAEARAAALKQMAEAAGSEAERARTRARALDQQVKAAEADIVAARARIALIAGMQDRERRRIAAKRGPIVHLLAALQTMARRPPALALAQPGSAADMVHVRLLLADALPVIEARTAALRASLARQTQLRSDAERAAGALAASRRLLAERRRALAVLEASATLQSQRFADQAAEEAQQALALGEEARDIADRMQTLSDAGDVRARLARLSPPDPRPPAPGDAVPVHRGGSRFLLPVRGEVASGFGEVSPAGVRGRGLTLAVAPVARVVAPHAGRVAFAAPFRSYGRIVILAHGGGWTTTITGLDRLAVRRGQWVTQGTTIGAAGPDAPHITTELRRGTRPVDVLALAQAG